jgi:signal transduction histidine kinase
MLLSKLLTVRRTQRCSPGNVAPLPVFTGSGKDLSPAESRLETTKTKGRDANLKIRSTRQRHSTRASRPEKLLRSLFSRNTALSAGLLAFFSVTCAAADSAPRLDPGGPWAGCALGFVFAILIAIFSRTRAKAAERELISLRELADHREYERNLARQELVKRLEEERELAKEKMQFESQLSEYEKFASLAQLALGAAHEINNPLLGILSHLELERREADGERREEIDQCIEGAKRISFAVRGLLDYARPGPLTLSKVSLRRLADETLNFVGHQPMFRQIELQNCIPADLPSITADSNQLSQILMNLLLNAAQATPPGGRITILADKVKFAEVIELRVRDTGSGIPADILPHVFEPFFTTKRGRGTGLGLSITQTYVRSHGVDIQVESIPGYGTTVRVTLPIRQAGKLVQHTEEVIA